MTNLSFRDVEKLSAFLDGQLSQAETTRLESRLRSDPALASTLADLRQARLILRRTPKRQVPRNFILTRRMAGIKPPIPRSVPVLSWASGIAALIFLISMGANLFSQLSLGAGAPMLAAAPASSQGYGYGGGPPAATESALTDKSLATPTPEAQLRMVPNETPVTQPGNNPPSEIKTAKETANLLPLIWLGLALVLIAAALVVSQANIRTFRRKTGGKDHS